MRSMRINTTRVIKFYFKLLSFIVCIVGFSMFFFIIPIIHDILVSGIANKMKLIFLFIAIIFGIYCIFVFYKVNWQFSEKDVSTLNLLLLYMTFMVLPVELKRAFLISNREDEIICYFVSLLIAILFYKFNKYVASKLFEIDVKTDVPI